ncbi:hypothetical protein BDQ17DRAFT_1334810 [Cyathus striatus]|nr:hypothetical protein BDQ17DRAFT_1334810 [Cyathus striatus]
MLNQRRVLPLAPSTLTQPHTLIRTRGPEEVIGHAYSTRGRTLNEITQGRGSRNEGETTAGTTARTLCERWVAGWSGEYEFRGAPFPIAEWADLIGGMCLWELTTVYHNVMIVLAFHTEQDSVLVIMIAGIQIFT